MVPCPEHCYCEERVTRVPNAWLSSLPCCEEEATGAPPSTLHECRLALEDRERVLQAFDLCCTAPAALLISLGLGDAPLLDFGIVLQNGTELCVRGLSVTRHLTDALVERRGGLRLILYVLVLERLRYCVFLRRLLIFCLRIGLVHLLCG